MATSRGATPADPTLVATTEDNSRGGLFVRSNVANPVQGVDVTGTVINDSTITIRINEGEPQTFTLNQANDETLSFTVATDSGGSGTADGVVTGVNFDPATRILTLTRSNNLPDLTANFTSLAFASDLTALTTRVNNLSFTNIGQTPDSLTGQGGQFVRVNTAEDSLEFVPEPTANVLPTSFSSADMSITHTAGTGADAGTVNLQARPTIIAQGGRGGITGTRQATSITLDPATGLVITEGASGVLTITNQAMAPAQGSAGVALTVPPTQTVLDTPTPPSGTINADPGSTITMVTGTLTGGDNNVNIPATTTIDTAGDMATVTFPMTTTDGGTGDYGATGEYTVTTMTTVEAPGAADNVITTTEMFNRFIPFYQVRGTTAPTTFAQLMAGTVSTTAFSNTEGFTSIGGTGNFYFATTVLTATNINTVSFGALPIRARVRHSGTITTTDAGGETLTYNVYQVAGVQAGQRYFNFRNE